MNKEIFKGKWNQFKGSVKKKWGELTDDEIDQINGDYDQLVGKIQERYGIEKQEAEKQVNEYLK